MPRIKQNQKKYMLKDLEAYIEGQRRLHKLTYEDLAVKCGHTRKTMANRIQSNELDNMDLITLFTLFDTDVELIGKFLKEKR